MKNSLLGTLLVTGVAAPALAQSIEIVNANFELPVLGPGGFTVTGLEGWKRADATNTSWGAFHPTDGTWGYHAPQGNQVLYINSGKVEQELATVVEAGMTYTLEVEVVYRPTFGTLIYTTELYAGDILLGIDNSTVKPPVGGHMTSTVEYTATENDPALGLPLIIRLGGANQVNFDEVRLNGVPTPGAAALMVLGLAAASRRRR